MGNFYCKRNLNKTYYKIFRQNEIIDKGQVGLLSLTQPERLI